MNKATLGVIIAIIVIAGAIWLYTANNPEQTPSPSGTQEEGTPELSDTPDIPNTQANLQTTIRGFAFTNKTIKIKAGTTIIWTNEDTVGHTVTSDSGTELNSKLLAKGESYSHTFTTVGTYNYHCAPHPSMKGTVIVE